MKKVARSDREPSGTPNSEDLEITIPGQLNWAHLAEATNDSKSMEIDTPESQELIPFQPVTATPTPQVRSSRLGTLRGVRRELARVYADARNGAVEASEATRLAYILTCLQKILEVESIEQRLDVLEQRGKPDA